MIKKKMMSIKNVFKLISVLCVIFSCISCQSNDLTITDEFQTTDEVLEYIAMTTPDKVIENTPGILNYHKEIKMWSISHSIAGTIDSVDKYLIAEMPNNKFSFEEGKQVTVSGFCYKIPTDILLDFAINKDMVFPAGTELYYIKISGDVDKSNADIACK